MWQRIITLIIGLLTLTGGVMAVSETLSVTSCTTAGCSTTNYNSNTTSIGATVAKNTGDTTGWSDSASSGSDTIDSFTFRLRHQGVTGVTGNTDITFQSVGGATTYCTDSTANSVSDTYVHLTPTGCSWTPARVDDLEIVITNHDTGSPTDVNYYFAQVAIEYTTSSNNVPSWNTNLADTPDPLKSGSAITYTGTGDDPDGDQYRMTVCRTNTINDGYPGTCAASQTLCTSAATNDLSQATCDYTTADTDIGTLTAYGFLCDAGSSTCNSTSTSTTTTVQQNLGILNWTITAPANLTNLTANQTFWINSTVTCLGNAGSTCGNVNATARYNKTGTIANTTITNVTGALPLYIMSTTAAWQSIPSSTGCFDVSATNQWSTSLENATITITLDNATLDYTNLDAGGRGFRVFNGTCASFTSPLYFAVTEGDKNKTFSYRNATNDTVLKVRYNTTLATSAVAKIAVVTTTNATPTPWENATKTFYAYDDWDSYDNDRYENISCEPNNYVQNGVLVLGGCSTFRSIVATKDVLPSTPHPLTISMNARIESANDQAYLQWYANTTRDSACTYSIRDSAGLFGPAAAGGLRYDSGNYTEGVRCSTTSNWTTSATSNTVFKTYQIRWSPEASYVANITQDKTRYLIQQFNKEFTTTPTYRRVVFMNRENNLGGSSNATYNWYSVETAPDILSVSITQSTGGGVGENPIGCGTLNLNGQCTISVLVNMTLNGKYFIDVLYNSTTYYPNITANDTIDRIVQNVTVGVGNSCESYAGSGTYALTCGCDFNVNTDLLGNTFTFSGEGTITMNANISNWSLGRITNSCVLLAQANGSLLWR